MYRIDILLKQNRRLFHTRDLAVLWGIVHDNTLYTAISRYVKKGILYSIQKGLYATVPVDELDPLTLGLAAVHGYAYVSCEYVLAQAGVIFQTSHNITMVSSVSRSFSLSGGEFVVRRMSDAFLFNDVGIMTSDGVFIATPERAAADMLYYQPNYLFDNRRAIDWKKVKTIQREVGLL